MKFLDDYGEKILYTTWGILFLIILIAGCDVKAHAASQNSTEIPYNVSEMQSYNEIMLDRLPVAISEYRRLNNLSEDVPLLVWTLDGFFNDYYYQYYFMQNPEYNSTIVEGLDFSSTALRFTAGSGEISYVLIDVNGQLGGSGTQHSTIADLCGTAQSVPTSQGYYLPRYPFFYNGDPVLSTNNIEVLINRVAHIGPSGSATEPDLTGDNIGSDKPDLDDYLPTLTNPPAINNNSLEDLVKSLYDLVLWHAGQIAGLVKGIGEFLADTITYSIQKVIDNIKNAMDNLYANFKSLFEPLLNGIATLIDNISQKFDYLTAPIDPAAISSGIEGTDLVTDVTGYKNALNTFVGSFNNVSEPSTYKIPIHFENISMFSDVGVQYLDLGWLNSVKTIIRGFVACLVTYGVIISIFDSVPNYINGGGGEDD